MFGKRRLSRLFSRFKRSLNVVLLGSHFYSMLLRRSLETKEESWVSFVRVSSYSFVPFDTFVNMILEVDHVFIAWITFRDENIY